MSSVESTFVLCVYLKFQNVEDRDEFIAVWKPLAEWVRANEAGTLGYEAMIADTDPLKVMVFERYISKEYFNDVHRTSQPYLAFKEQQASWRADHAVEVSGQSYFETGVGHMTQPESQQLVASSVSSEGRPVQQVQRALGLDYGRRVVGLAVSTLGLAPRPLEGVPGCASAADQLATASAVLDVAARERCDAIVVGLPVTSTGSLRRRDTDSQQGRRCRNFASTLASLAEPRGLQVFLTDERGSTLEARQFLEASGSRRSTFGKRKDSVSAAVILTTFFDSPHQAVRVKPWRPPGAAGAVAGGAVGNGLQPLLCMPFSSAMLGMVGTGGKRAHGARRDNTEQQGRRAQQQQQGRQLQHQRELQQAGQQQEQERHQPQAAEQQAADGYAAAGHEG
ncbi:hypothetical protein ABPG77_001929 [Micractinium sp. CCAP 211/92]